MTIAIRNDVDKKSLKLKPAEEKTMDTCIKLSIETWTGLVDGEVACVWGVVPPSLLSNQAYLWLYTTDLVKDHQFLFVRHSQREIEKLLKEYETIIGFCSPKAKSTVRWLRWLGAVFSVPEDDKMSFIIRRR